MRDDDEVTRDTLLRGRVKLLQPRDGYRSSLDPLLLAGFLAPPYGVFLDIGCGAGPLAFLLLARDEAATGVAVEIQPRLAGLAEQGRIANDFGRRLRVIPGDVREDGVVDAEAFDLVATNPPFRAMGAGVLSPVSEKALAHHEVTLNLAGWLSIAARALRAGGRLGTIFPFDRWQELRAGLSERGFSVTRFRQVVPRAGGLPGRVLVEAKKGAFEAREEAALIVHDERGYTAEVKGMLGEEA